MAFQPVLRRRLYQEVADRIEHMIRDGDLPEGKSLPAERELMEHFAVGRPAIREALLSLQQKGLIVPGNGERARVSRPDADRLIGALSGAAQVYLSQDEGVRQFQAARKLFEAAIARQAAQIATHADIARMEAALEANRAARGDAHTFEATDVAFHLEIVRTAGNPLLTGVHQALTGWLTEQRSVSLTARGAEASAFGAHARIFAAIAAHDPDAAEAADADASRRCRGVLLAPGKVFRRALMVHERHGNYGGTLAQGQAEARRTRVRAHGVRVLQRRDAGNHRLHRRRFRAIRHGAYRAGSTRASSTWSRPAAAWAWRRWCACRRASTTSSPARWTWARRA